LVGKFIQVKPVKSDAALANRDFCQVRTCLTVKYGFAHAQISWGIAQSDKSRCDRLGRSHALFISVDSIDGLFYVAKRLLQPVINSQLEELNRHLCEGEALCGGAATSFPCFHWNHPTPDQTSSSVVLKLPNSVPSAIKKRFNL
jgi:hypothetical protein